MVIGGGGGLLLASIAGRETGFVVGLLVVAQSRRLPGLWRLFACLQLEARGGAASGLHGVSGVRARQCNSPFISLLATA